ncbi:GDP/GTP exchange factor for ARF [Mycoemilia scoparia]|uniref:GDP/GTP exchange factor for ARF n=1 Tax=Mycoemilia scoparia TaxID=417184 RepID=A0A9W7ZQN3_9FUNG|nr:GDP/GTP exchange factor for ARF [Mycoemilia scoparia]
MSLNSGANSIRISTKTTGPSATFPSFNDSSSWRLFIENEIDSVVRELYKNARWAGIAKRKGIGSLWTGGGHWSFSKVKHVNDSSDDLLEFEYPTTKQLDRIIQTQIQGLKYMPHTKKNVSHSSNNSIKSPLLNQSAGQDVGDANISGNTNSSNEGIIDTDNVDAYIEEEEETEEGRRLEDCKRLYKSKNDIGKLGASFGIPVSGSSNEEYPYEFEKFSRLHGFLMLRKTLCGTTDARSISPIDILDPFLDIVRIGEATGPIARAALLSVERMVSHGLLDNTASFGESSSILVVEALLAITDAVTNCRFEETDSATNESVLLQILSILKFIMNSKLSDKLSDEAICKIIETVLSMSCQMRLSEILRKSAESTLFELVSVIFHRLNQITIQGKSGIRGDGSVNSRDSKDVVSDLAMNPPSTSDPVYSKRPTNNARPLTPRLDRIRASPSSSSLDAGSLYSDNSSARYAESSTGSKPKTSGANEAENVSAQESNLDLSKPVVSATNDNSSSTNEDLSGEGGEISPYSMPSIIEVFRVLVQLLNPKDLKFTDTMRLMALNALNVAFNVAGTSLSKHPPFRLVTLDSLCRYLLLILAGNQVNLIPSALRLQSVLFHTHKKFCKHQIELFLCQTIGRLMEPVSMSSTSRNGSVEPQGNHRDGKHTSGAVGSSSSGPMDLNTSFESGNVSGHSADSSYASLFDISSFDRIAHSEQVSLYHEMSLRRGVRGKIAHGHVRRLLLEGFHHLLTSDESFLLDLWVNYDCDQQHGNLCSFLIKFIAHNSIPIVIDEESSAAPDTEFESEYEAYQDILLYHLGHMVKRSKDKPIKDGLSSSVPSISSLLESKNHKDDMMRAATWFNKKPKEGIAYLQKIGYLPLEHNHEMMAKLAKFLKQTPTLDKALVGEYLAKPSNTEILQVYMTTFDFENKRLDEAMRMILGTFRLPGESQQIERIMEHFSSAYFDSGPESIATKDAAFVLAFAVIMLNTDLHSPQVKSRMKLNDFCRNLRGVNDGSNFSLDFMESVYEAIRQREIVFPEEHEGEAGFEYAWKEMWTKDGELLANGNFREESNYGTTGVNSNKGQSSALTLPCLWLSTGKGASSMYDPVVFKLLWPQYLMSSLVTFVRSQSDYLLQYSLKSYQGLATLATRYRNTACFDRILAQLIELSGLTGPSVTVEVELPQILRVDGRGGHVVIDTKHLELMDQLPDLSSPFSAGSIDTPFPEDAKRDVLSQRKDTLATNPNSLVTEIDRDQQSSYTMTQLGLQLGKGYSSQLVVLLLFNILSKIDYTIMSTASWERILDIIYLFVNADILPRHMLRVKDIWVGKTLIPRRDMLYQWEKDSLSEQRLRGRSYVSGTSSTSAMAMYRKSHSQNANSASGSSGLFSALSSYFGGSNANTAVQPDIRWNAPRRYLIEYVRRARMCVEASHISEFVETWDNLPPEVFEKLIMLMSQRFPLSSVPSPTQTTASHIGGSQAEVPSHGLSVPDGSKLSNTGTPMSRSPQTKNSKELLTGDKSEYESARLNVNSYVNYNPGELFFMEQVFALGEVSSKWVCDVWPKAEKAFDRLLEQADTQHLFVVERTVSGLLRFATVLSTSLYKEQCENSRKRSQEMLERVFRCLGLLRDVNASTFARAADQIAVGLYDMTLENPHPLLQKQVWSVVSFMLNRLASTSDEHVYPSVAQSIGFSAVLNLGKAFFSGDIALVHQAQIIDELKAYMPPSKFFKMIGGGNTVSQGYSGSNKGVEVEDPRIALQVQVSNQESARKTVSQIIGTINRFGDYIKREHLRNCALPVTEIAMEKWIEILAVLSTFCYNPQREIRSEAGPLLQQALIGADLKPSIQAQPDSSVPHSIGTASSSQWVMLVFTKVLFPLFDNLLRFDILADFHMEDAHTRAISTLVTFFLHHVSELQILSANGNQSHMVVSPGSTSEYSGSSLGAQYFAETKTSKRRNSVTLKKPQVLDLKYIWFRIANILIKYIKEDQPQQSQQESRESSLPAIRVHQKMIAEIAENNLKNVILVLNSLNVFTGNETDESMSDQNANTTENVLSAPQTPNVAESSPETQQESQAQPRSDSQINLTSIAQNTTDSDIVQSDSKYNALWKETWQLIDPIKPELKYSLFPDTAPPPQPQQPFSEGQGPSHDSAQGSPKENADQQVGGENEESITVTNPYNDQAENSQTIANHQRPESNVSAYAKGDDVLAQAKESDIVTDSSNIEQTDPGSVASPKLQTPEEILDSPHKDEAIKTGAINVSSGRSGRHKNVIIVPPDNADDEILS